MKKVDSDVRYCVNTFVFSLKEVSVAKKKLNYKNSISSVIEFDRAIERTVTYRVAIASYLAMTEKPFYPTYSSNSNLFPKGS